MDIAEFRKSVARRTPPADLAPLLQALWYEAQGDWGHAHGLAQSAKGRMAAAAYLHRREGDLANADYWYERAGRERTRGALDREWEALASELLGQGKE